MTDFSWIQKEHKRRTGCNNAISDKISLQIFVASELTYTQNISGQFLPGFHSKRCYTMKGLIFLSILVASFTVLVSGKSLSNVFPFRSLFMVRFFKEMVFCYQNCSDLLWEKNALVIEENFWNSRLKAKNLQNLWDH